MRHVAIVALAMGWAQVALAQPPGGELRGAVRDDGGTPIADVVVMVDGAKVDASTGPDGTFVIPLSAGTHQVRVTAMGYSAAESSIVVVAGTATPARYTLEPLSVGSEVIDIVSRSPEKTIDVPATVGLVKPDVILTNVSYQAGLANVPGVDVYSTSVGTSAVSTRGFYKQLNLRMVSMVDGHVAQLPGSGISLGDWAPASPLDMSFVEIVIGPSSAQYGANAISGVVDVRTKSPWDESGVALLARGGTQAFAEGAARVAGTIGNSLGWKMNAQYLQADDWVPERSDNTHFFGTGGGRFPVAVFEGDIVDDYNVSQLKLDGAAYYRFSDWQAKLSSGYALVDGQGLINTGRWRARGASAFMNVAQLKSPHWYFSAGHTFTSAGDSYFVDQAVQRASAMGGVPTDEAGKEAIRKSSALVDDSQLLDVEAQYQGRASIVDVTAGTEGRLYVPDQESTYLAGRDGVDMQTAEGGVFLQGDSRFVDERLRVVGAARVDVHESYGAQVSPKLVTSFEIAPRHVARVGVSRSYKSPSIVEQFLSLPIAMNGPYALGNRDGFEIRDGSGTVLGEIDPLEPEIGTAIEAGYKSDWGHGFYGELVGHYTFYENFISALTPVTNASSMTAPTFAYTHDGNMVQGNGTLFTYVNFGKANVAGSDIRAAYEDEHFMASASASYIHIMSREVGGSLNDANNVFTKQMTLNVPPLKTVTSVAVKNLGMKGWFLRVDGRFRSAFRFESGYWSSSAMLAGGELPDRFVLDASAGYEIPRTGMALSLVAKNVLDDDKLDVLGAPAPRRLVFLQLEYRAEGLAF